LYQSRCALDALSGVTNNKDTVRAPIAIALVLSVQGAALGARFVHLHPDDHATAHHSGRVVHTHWAGHARSAHPEHTASLGPADSDRAIFGNTFIAVAVSVLAAPAVALTTFVLVVPVEQAAHRPVDVVRSHDPPYVGVLSSRAPPAFLS
jgi:hypothetical protein